MGNTVTIAMISAAAVVLSAIVGFLGVVVARRSDRDDDTREWVSIRMGKQDDDIRRLGEKVDDLEAELRAAQATAVDSERTTVSLAGYIREVLTWVGIHFPDAAPPEAHGRAKEVLRNG